LVANCTLNGNVAESSGGAVYNNAAGAVFENCTFSGNSSTFGNGGAIFGGASSSTYELVVRSCTFSVNNTGNLGGGIAVGGGGATYLANSILKNNGPSNLHVFTGTFVSQGYNLSSDAGGGYLTATGDKVNTDPLLGPLASNGGPTQTHALLPDSPAINMGFPDLGPPGDQRGYPRIGRQDIGAFEFDSFALRIISIDPSGRRSHKADW
jgi:predicted outer membrane repeat protein